MARIERQQGQTFCQHCSEPLAMGEHAIAFDKAQAMERQKCPDCKTTTLAACILGLGHFVYVCEGCNRKWSNMDS